MSNELDNAQRRKLTHFCRTNEFFVSFFAANHGPRTESEPRMKSVSKAVADWTMESEETEKSVEFGRASV